MTRRWSLALILLLGSPLKLLARPLIEPSLFAEGVISTADDEFGGAFTPDGNTFFFAKKTQSTLRSSVIVICFSTYRNDRWTMPQVAPFSGRYKDFNPALSPDGRKLFFISNRPVDEKPKRDTDIWVVEKTADGWGEPKNLGLPVNSPALELGCSITADGTLYFSSTRGDGNPDIYRSRYGDGKYLEPENLGDAINTPFLENEPFIAPDESFLLFSSKGRTDALAGGGAPYPRSDLYISYRKDGKWTPAKSLGPLINSVAEDTNPLVSPDGRTLFFTSERSFVTVPMKKGLTYKELETSLHRPRNGLGDIYQIDMRAITVQ